jgi:hypothetical protein
MVTLKGQQQLLLRAGEGMKSGGGICNLKIPIYTLSPCVKSGLKFLNPAATRRELPSVYLGSSIFP